MTDILVIDDDPLICKGLKFQLEQAGYRVMTATNASAALDTIARRTFDAVLLDIGLPGRDGLSVCQEIKANYDVPIIFLTARRRELDEIVGLQVGADDYITKPFSVDLVLAHLKAVLRRQQNWHERSECRVISVGDFTVEPDPHRAMLKGEMLALAPREFDLLHFFLQNPDHVFSADEIIERVWGSEFVGQPQVLYVQVRSLREKIEEDPSNPRHLVTLRGVGYKFVP